MAKAINVILGIGVAIVLFLFFILALKIIFPDPETEDCWNKFEETPLRVKTYDNLTEKERQELDQIEKERQECYDRNEELRGKNNNRIFIGAVIIGILLILAIIPLLSMTNIATGVGAAGIALTVYGFSIGWRYSGDYVKLAFLFVAATIIISLAVWLNKKGMKKKK